MRFLHYQSWLERGDVAEVTLDSQANVKLMGEGDFTAYRTGRSHRYYGGLAKSSPVELVAPHTGHWHVTIDLGGYSGNVRAGVRFLRG